MRTIEKRFQEHIKEAYQKNRNISGLHSAIAKYGKDNFFIEEIEKVSEDKIDEREIYWISHYKAREKNIGYNIAPGGKNRLITPYNCIMVIENNLIFDSKENMAEILSNFLPWQRENLKDFIEGSLKEEKDFFGYHLKSISWVEEKSNLEEIKQWINSFNISFLGKYVYCEELNQEFKTITEAAKYLINNNLYITNSKTPIQSLATAIGKNLHGKTSFLKGVNGSLHFVEITGKTTKQEVDKEKIFKGTSVYCPQINKTFKTQTEAAHYFLDNKIWNNISLKTARLRISDVVNERFPDYRNYTFKRVEK